MSHFIVRKTSQLKGEIAIPPSKSHTMRAILFGAMANGKTTIHTYLNSPDTEAMVDAFRMLGASIDVFEEHLEIEGLKGKISFAEDVIHSGNSGLVLRFISALAALSSNPIVITGDYSIRHHRPMIALLNGLEQLGVKATSTRGDGFAPVIVQGPMHSGRTVVNGEDSQPVSSLLIACAFAQGPFTIEVKNAGEKPWVAFTLDWFDRLGIKYVNYDFSSYQIMGNEKIKGFDYRVPGDWSSAAFPIAAALITNSEVVLQNVDINDCQGDKQLIEVLQKMGAKFEISAEHRTLKVLKGSHLKSTEVDINDFVDAITILAVIGCFADGELRIRNALVARQKECDRISSIAIELRKMGADIEEHIDGLTVRRSQLHGARLQSYHDHRMAMSLAVAALGAEGESRIDEVDCVAKTFPFFAQNFHRLGANVEVME